MYISNRSCIGLYCPYGEYVTVGGLCGDSQLVCGTYYHVVDRETIGISMLSYDQSSSVRPVLKCVNVTSSGGWW